MSVLVLQTVVCLALALALVRERRAAARRAELVARAGHEIRGPLTAAGLALHGLQRRGVPVDPVQRELRRAEHALADLAVAPAARRALDHPQIVDLAALLRAQQASWQPLADHRGATLEVDAAEPALVRGDELRLLQACANLVANAVEHGGGRVVVRLRHVADRITVEVADEGPGLPATVASLAARPRAGRGSRGRGLAIARQIATDHGGGVASAPCAAGGLVVLELPALRAARLADAGSFSSGVTRGPEPVA